MDALQEYFGIKAFDFDVNKQILIDNLNQLKGMTVEEQTFYKKWLEVQGYRDVANKLNTIKARIWRPSDFNDEVGTIKELENCQPELVGLSIFVTTMLSTSSPELSDDSSSESSFRFETTLC